MDDERIIRKLANVILMIEKSEMSNSKSKDSKIQKKIKKLIEDEVK